MRTKNYTSEELIKKLVEEKLHLQRVPTARDMDNASKAGRGPASTVYQYHFETFNRALQAAGLKINKAGKREKKKLLDDLKKIYALRTRVATIKELKKYHESGFIAERTSYLDAFGTMKKAYEAAGIDMAIEKKNWATRRRDKLILQLKNLSVEEKINLSRSKALFLYKKGKIGHISTFVEVFGTWVKALKIAGVKPRRKRYSREELISILKSEYKFTNQAPTSTYFSMMSKQGLLPCPGTFCYHFESWNKALIVANVVTNVS